MNQERRQNFRLDDEIHLEYCPIDEEGENLTPANGEHQRISDELVQLRELAQQSSHILASIRKREPEIASYLALLDKRIEHLIRLNGNQLLGEEVVPNHRVNLSSTGIAFSHHAVMEKGIRLRLQMVLFPSLLRIDTPATVQSCRQHAEAGKYWIGCAFDPLDTRHEEALIRHLLERQSQMLRKKRESGL